MGDRNISLFLNNQFNMTEKERNPIIDTYRGYDVRLYPQIKIRVSPYEFKRFIDAKLDNNMSAMEAIKNKKVFCKDCNDIGIKKYS